jgi:ATP/maltotriose-dependent transcriptional regulator MalT
VPRPEHLVGRIDEVAYLGQLLDGLDGGRPGALSVVGEPGIGKTRLLAELGARAEQRRHLVLYGSAAELERDLPFSVFLDALDEYVESIDPDRLAALDDEVKAELAHVFPSLAALGRGRRVVPQQERYRTHRAVRSLLEHLAQGRPVVLALDDLHWADPASIELLGALVRRPPGASVGLALALRPRQVSERLSAALERSRRAGSLTQIELGPLTRVEARDLLADAVGDATATELYEESGGNPFYLQQLARSRDRSGGHPAAGMSLTGIGVPSAVAASLNEELGLLQDDVRRVLQGAAVAGDPFEPELAAAAAAVSEGAAMDAIDELLQLDVVRGTDVPRRFRFRHPLVRRAIYESTPGGWRLGAHERCAAALAARGVAAAARAHHVERSARQGDLAAVALLREAGEEAARLAPDSAARWLGGALRLLPESVPALDRVELLLARAGALAAAGHFTDSHDEMLEAVALVPAMSGVVRTRVATACAGVERFLGRYDQANARLVAALRALPEPDSAVAAELLIELTLNEFYRSRYDVMHEWAARAVDAARVAGRRALMATALAMPALADAMTGPTEAGRSHRAEAATLVDALPDEELAIRPDAAGWLAIAEVYLDLYAEADVHASRALRLTRATGLGDPLHRLYPVLPRVWYVRGKLSEAAELLDGAIEAMRLLGSPPALAGNLFNRSVVALAVGDLDLALSTAVESVELTGDLDEGFVRAWAGARLAGVRFEIGQPELAVDVLLERAGGEDLALIPGGWRACFLELLTRCWLALERPLDAERAAGLAGATAAHAGLPLAGAWAARASAAVALHAGDTAGAVERALDSADQARAVGAPIEEALSRTLAGRALARDGQRDRAVAELQRAAATLDACGALRYRASAERELGKLGRRAQRRPRSGETGRAGIGSLTERELEVARLVVDRKTNGQIAAELFLSPKTVEAHLRNIFNKVGVGTRVALAQAVERADEPPSLPSE